MDVEVDEGGGDVVDVEVGAVVGVVEVVDEAAVVEVVSSGNVGGASPGAGSLKGTAARLPPIT